MSLTPTLGTTLDTLFADIDSRRDADPEVSWTARLLAKGPVKCAKKVGEEGVELALAIVAESDEAVAAEAADLLYHMAVALAVRNIAPQAVAAALASRRGVSGLDEKAARTE
jgi:phosphoribosyl-ATP pyrophosphohydrolase